jgi:hypothetical protein
MKMDNEAIAPEVPVDDSTPMTLAQRLTNIVFEPGKVFDDINRKPSWLWIFLIICAVMIAIVYVTNARVDQEALIRSALGNTPFQLSEEQIQQAVVRQQTPAARIMAYVSAPLSALIQYLLLGGLFLLVFVMMGVSLKFKKSLAVTTWAFAPPLIVQNLLSILILYLKEPGTINPMNGILFSNPGALVDGKAHPVLSSLLGSLDIFSFWTIALLSLGFATISDRKLTTKKSLMGIVILWALFVLGKAGFRAL